MKKSTKFGMILMLSLVLGLNVCVSAYADEMESIFQKNVSEETDAETEEETESESETESEMETESEAESEPEEEPEVKVGFVTDDEGNTYYYDRNGINIDELVKRIDEKIAELEREEQEEGNANGE